MAHQELDTRPSGQLVQWLASKADVDSESIAFEVTANQLDALLSAANEDDLMEVLQGGGTTGGREFEDIEFQLDSFTVHKASEQYKAPLGHYVIIHGARLSDGSEVLLNTAAPLIIGLIRWYDSKEKLPAQVVIRGADTPNGRRLWMEPIPKRALQGQAAEDNWTDA